MEITEKMVEDRVEKEVAEAAWRPRKIDEWGIEYSDAIIFSEEMVLSNNKGAAKCLWEKNGGPLAWIHKKTEKKDQYFHFFGKHEESNFLKKVYAVIYAEMEAEDIELILAPPKKRKMSSRI